jgi:hypothetical protein
MVRCEEMSVGAGTLRDQGLRPGFVLRAQAVDRHRYIATVWPPTVPSHGPEYLVAVEYGFSAPERHRLVVVAVTK